MKATIRTKAVIITAILAFILFIFDGTPFLLSDSYAYYHGAKSLVTTGRVYTTEKPEYYRYTPHVTEYNGKYITVVNPGNTFLIAPAIAVAQLFYQGTIYTSHHMAFIGHSLADGTAVLATDVILALASLYFMYKIAREFGFSRKISLLSVFAVAASTYIYTYTFEAIGFTHIPELFGSSGMLFCISKIVNKSYKNTHLILLGAFTGIVISARPTNVLIALPLLAFAAIYLFKNKASLPQYAKSLLMIICGGIPFAITLMAYNYSCYGGILKNGYSTVANAGGIFDFRKWHIVDLLFSPVRGWFIYTPVALLSLAGLVKACIKEKKLIAIMVTPVMLLILLFSFFPYWWGGDSYGQRFFVVLAPFLVYGVAYILVNTKQLSGVYRAAIYTITAICVLYSMSITMLIRITPLQSIAGLYHKASDLPVSIPIQEAYSTGDIYHYHIDTITEATSVKDYAQKIIAGYQGARSNLMLILGFTDPIIKVEPVSADSFSINIIPTARHKEIITDMIIYTEYKNTSSKTLIKQVDTRDFYKIAFTCTPEMCTCKDSKYQCENVSNYYSADIKIVGYDYYNIGVGYANANYIGDKIKFVDEKLVK